MAQLYGAFNYSQVNPGTNAPAGNGGVTSATTNFTMLQLQVPTTQPPLKVIEWGISFNASALTAPFPCDLVETGTVNATVTAFSLETLVLYGDPNAPAVTTSIPVTMSTSASGFTSSAEGTLTGTTIKTYDAQLLEPIGGYVKQFPFGKSPTSRRATFEGPVQG